MPSSQQILVSGGFDDMRSRHFRFLEEAARLGPLKVFLWSDETIQQSEGKPPKFPENERLYFLRAIRYVNDVELLHEKVHRDSLPNAANLKSATWVVEAAQDNAAKKTFCEANGIQYRVLRDEELAGFPHIPMQPASPGRKKVIVTGCYDWLHSGHVRFFEEASGYGDLFVVVGHDANIRLLKGEGRPLFPEEERRYVVGSIRFVRQSLVSTGDGWLDAEPEMQIIKPDIYAVNEDGDVPEKREYCQRHRIEYLVLKRKPAAGLPRRSSTDLRGY